MQFLFESQVKIIKIKIELATCKNFLFYIYLFNTRIFKTKMLTEALTIAFIIGACGIVAWMTKNKFQPEIEEDIRKREQKATQQSQKISRG